MENKLDLTAPIIPDHGLGGLVLRTKLIELQELVEGLGVLIAGSYELVGLFEARYRFGQGEIEMGVDVRNGKIARLVAGAQYKGALFEKIFVGMSVGEAMKLEPRLYYDEAEETVLCRGVAGVALDLPELDPSPELVPMMLIKAISVTPKELLTYSGQVGLW